MKHSKINPTIQLILATALFVISVIASRGSQMTDLEIVIFQAIYDLPDLLRPFFFVITQLGSIHALALLVIIYAFTRHYHIVTRLLLTGTLTYTITGAAKDLWGRARPNELLADVVNLDYIVRGPGFPSGHMALATALALTLAHYLPKKYRWVPIAWIVGVGLSRMYLGVHAPLDIVGGFAIGWGVYALFRHVRLHDVRFRKKHSKK